MNKNKEKDKRIEKDNRIKRKNEQKAFASKVYTELMKVPKGKAITYKALARMAGNPNAARAVGNLMKNNKNPKYIPCYKVVKSNGEVGEYSAKGGKKKKIQLLKKEGIEIKKEKIDERYLIR